ncbi:MAG: hypothetical protein IKQ71_01900 [Lachnospiraceae bacterium]|nr:hypothetical protein [Lachnospiraceae bacterium]
MNNKRWLHFAFVFLILFSVFRIAWVNYYAKTPEKHLYLQNEKIISKGVSYSLEKAVLWNYDLFFDNYPEYKEYKEEDKVYKNAKLLMLDIKVEIQHKENVFNASLPLKYENVFNMPDPFFFEALNPILKNGIHSGDIIKLPYEIYSINLKKDQWRKVCDSEMEYNLVFSNYPERKELRINDYEVME